MTTVYNTVKHYNIMLINAKIVSAIINIPTTIVMNNDFRNNY